ncbi:uncharacterized protein SPPG_04361 [Spizellomyces punctatus DAOM BR117]|uniref:Cyclic nucleotide-binding domain-containing protein n=1 Tax=Spizellomyces punctatus (strain DAOM BR117) TaxID=645134 RepID=A0A0L0HGH3_SPIPD|nr:uncharacterized protein SPPG_04361 [Spizellomyces punctatus DAOM BR117]KND00015.1 hypothetical protein SPPG_04361 [Spizellomyces punctatus DAOM BR117]|eukprot:XP_016608054.1 hypothetical protein SPPG_04361 [Spizellomyces punctatus DAOM BR117]
MTYTNLDEDREAHTSSDSIKSPNHAEHFLIRQPRRPSHTASEYSNSTGSHASLTRRPRHGKISRRSSLAGSDIGKRPRASVGVRKLNAGYGATWTERHSQYRSTDKDNSTLESILYRPGLTFTRHIDRKSTNRTSTNKASSTHGSNESISTTDDTRPSAKEWWKMALERIGASVRALRAFQIRKAPLAEGIGARKALESGQSSLMASKVGFKMSTYRRRPDNAHLHLSPTLLAALAKTADPDSLTTSDIDNLFHLTSLVPVFAKYDEGIRRALARVITYEVFEAGRVVVRQGHEAQNFYHILSGEVEVTKKVEDRVIVISVLKGGDSFGETSLLRNHRRSATVTTLTTPTAFLRVAKSDFNEILQHETQADVDAKIALIGSIPLFACLAPSAIRHLAVVSRTRSLASNEVIVAEGEVPGFLFIIREGACRVVKAVKFNRMSDIHGRIRIRPYIPPPPPIRQKTAHSLIVHSTAGSRMHSRGMAVERGTSGYLILPPIASSSTETSKAKEMGHDQHNPPVPLPALPSSKNLVSTGPSSKFTTLLLSATTLTTGACIGATSAILSHCTGPHLRFLPPTASPRSSFSLITSRPTRVLLLSRPDFARLCTTEMAEMIGKDEKEWQATLSPEALADAWKVGYAWKRYKKRVFDDAEERVEEEKQRKLWTIS